VQFFGYDDKGRANPHVDPAHYPENSFAMSDTHDLPPLRVWMESSPGTSGIPSPPSMPYRPGRKEFLRLISSADPGTAFRLPFRWVMLSLQTILGLGAGHRINMPGTVGNQNWTWRMPQTLKNLPVVPWLPELIENPIAANGSGLIPALPL